VWSGASPRTPEIFLDRGRDGCWQPPPHRSVPERLTHTAPPSDQRSDVRDVVTCRVSHVAIKTCGIRLKVREIGGKLGPPTKWMTRNWGHPRSGSPPWLDAEPGPAIGRVQRELIPIVATNWVAVSSPPACQINDRIHPRRQQRHRINTISKIFASSRRCAQPRERSKGTGVVNQDNRCLHRRSATFKR